MPGPIRRQVTRNRRNFYRPAITIYADNESASSQKPASPNEFNSYAVVNPDSTEVFQPLFCRENHALDELRSLTKSNSMDASGLPLSHKCSSPTWQHPYRRQGKEPGLYNSPGENNHLDHVDVLETTVEEGCQRVTEDLRLLDFNGYVSPYY